MNWTEEFREALTHPGITLPQKSSPILHFYVDTCKRVSKCRVCDSGIQKGEKRAVFAMRLGYRKMMKGGFSGQKFFCHVSCVSSILNEHGGPKRPQFNQCRLCGKFLGNVLGRVPGSVEYFGNEMTRICYRCATDLTPCVFCNCYFRARDVSKIIGARNTKYLGKFCCEKCTWYEETVTVKERKRQQLADIRLDKKVDQIKAYYATIFGEHRGAPEDTGELTRQD